MYTSLYVCACHVYIGSVYISFYIYIYILSVHTIYILIWGYVGSAYLTPHTKVFKIVFMWAAKRRAWHSCCLDLRAADRVAMSSGKMRASRFPKGYFDSKSATKLTDAGR